jgi:hypothetical protein
MMANVKDFDAFWAEQNKEQIPFKIFGQTEYLPPSLPALMVLKMIKMQKEYGKKDIPESELFDLATSVFGQGKIEEWCSKGLTVDQLTDLISWAMEQYNPGNPQAPEVKGQE